MAKIQPVWALDIGQSALKALKLIPAENPSQVMAEAFDFIEYPKILSQPDADPEELVQQALHTFLERNELKGCKVVVGVPGQQGLVKFIKLPPVEKKRIPDIVRFEARQQIPFALEEVIWDYQQIGNQDDGDDELTMAEVGMFAMKRDQINRAILPFKNAGIEVDIVQMSPIALCNAITFDRLKAGDKAQGSVVVMDIGADNTDLIITDGTRIWQRNVPIGGNHFTRGLTKELKLTFAKAEHLKRNATKAPDPRSIFTAMRGVFNDLASEVNRSIGFYTSINRSAKISRVLGLGNGFKLPGLQKFLLQNLNQEVEKLEKFENLVGPDVIENPQFVENAASFAVAYGLALQGLGKSVLKTNLLPPEIEQTRMIRRKKPWALVASVLLLLGFTFLFLGEWKVWAGVSKPEWSPVTNAAKQESTRGSGYASAFTSAESAFKALFNEGKALVPDLTNQAEWPRFRRAINDRIPDPINELGLDPEDPASQLISDKLRVYVDRIRTVYRKNLKADWFDGLPDFSKNLMHPYDRDNPPTGEGWVVQVFGHHFNPDPSKQTPDPVDKGSYYYTVNQVLPRFRDEELRVMGIHHAALRSYLTEPNWSPDMAKGMRGGSANSELILARATPTESSSASATGAGAAGTSKETAGMMSAMKGSTGPSKAMMGGGSNPMDMMKSMGGVGMMNMRGGAAGGQSPADKSKIEAMTRQRTDFLIEFLYQPPAAGAKVKTAAEFKKDMDAAAAKKKGAATVISEASILAASKNAIRKAQTEREAAAKKSEEPPPADSKSESAPGAETPAPPTDGGTAAKTAPPAPAAPPK